MSSVSEANMAFVGVVILGDGTAPIIGNISLPLKARLPHADKATEELDHRSGE